MKFKTKEKRDALAKSLADIARQMAASRDRGGHHQILVTDEMIEDIQVAAVVVGLTEVTDDEPESNGVGNTK